MYSCLTGGYCAYLADKSALRIIVAIIIVSIVASRPNAAMACVYEPSVWEKIEAVSGAELAGMVLLLGLFLLLAIVGVRVDTRSFGQRGRRRDYESRVLSAVFYNHVDRAISLASTFPSSPVAAVVTASLERSRYQAGEARIRLSKLGFQHAVVAQT